MSRITFEETMTGRLLPGPQSFSTLDDPGPEAQPVELRLSLIIDDLEAFLADPRHEGRLTGTIASPFLGSEPQPVVDGRFHLLEPTADRDRRDMSYRFACRDAQGRPLSFHGLKQVQNHLGPDLWRDTTTLDFNLFAGHLPEGQPPQGEVVATGRIRIDLPGFLRQLASLRSDASDPVRRARELARFGAFFLGELWHLYAPRLPAAQTPGGHPIPLFSDAGVPDARRTCIPFQSADGLGLSLTRYQRGPDDALVLLVPGLTASSDLFTLPEQYNLTRYLLDQGFGDVWILDGRISNRHPYNLQRHRWSADDVALYDYPAALETIRRITGAHKPIHVVAHCFGALTFTMSLAAGLTGPIQSLVVNGVALTPRVPRLSRLKLALGPGLMENLLGVEYINPRWRRQPGFSPAKLLAWGVSLAHGECNCPECHMISFMWGSGKPALYRHENLHPITHRRIGDLLGGSGVHYYRHIHKMVKAGRAVKYDPTEPRHGQLPDDYLEAARRIQTPILFVSGQQNRVFTDSNVHCHRWFEAHQPGRHRLHLFPDYGHIDVIMGRRAHRDTFPTFIQFMKRHQGG